MHLRLELITSPLHIPAIAHVRHLAFAPNQVHQLMYPSVSTYDLEAWFAERDMRDARNPLQRMVAVMDGQRIVAYAKWEVPADLSMDIPGAMENMGERGRFIETPDGVDQEVYGLFRGGIDKMRTVHSNPREDFALHTLSTLPEYQGRGCAGMLLRWGVEQADAARRKCYLESSPVAYGLYCKFGWKTVDEITLDLTKFGGGEHKITIMMRNAKGAS